MKNRKEPQQKKAFSEYEKYGLTYDEKKDRFRFQGKTVRYFTDGSWEENEKVSSGKGFSYYDGEVDLKAVRNSSNQLIGIEELSQQEFDERTEKRKKNTYPFGRGAFEQGDFDSESDTLNAYRSFGITFDKMNDAWMYKNKKIYGLYDKDILTFVDRPLEKADDSIALEVIRNKKGKIQELKEFDKSKFARIYKK